MLLPTLFNMAIVDLPPCLVKVTIKRITRPAGEYMKGQPEPSGKRGGVLFCEYRVRRGDGPDLSRLKWSGTSSPSGRLIKPSREGGKLAFGGTTSMTTGRPGLS